MLYFGVYTAFNRYLIGEKHGDIYEIFNEAIAAVKENHIPEWVKP